MRKPNLPLLDSLSRNAKLVYMFLLLQGYRHLDPDAVASRQRNYVMLCWK